MICCNMIKKIRNQNFRRSQVKKTALVVLSIAALALAGCKDKPKTEVNILTPLFPHPPWSGIASFPLPPQQNLRFVSVELFAFSCPKKR